MLPAAGRSAETSTARDLILPPGELWLHMQMGRAKAGRCGVLLLTGSRPAGGAAMLAALEPFEQLAAQIIAAGGAKSVDRHLSLKNWQPFLDPQATSDHKQWPGTATCTATLLVADTSRTCLG
jgi:hypothetical protein